MSSDADVHAELARLCALHPLPVGWCSPDCYVEVAEIGALRVNLIGLLTRRADGREVTGSAGEPGAFPVARAYFELIERACVVDAASDRAASFSSYDSADGTPELACEYVFPEAGEGSRFSYARSNAVAAHSERLAACESARAELIERDRLLRAWYGETKPLRSPLPDTFELTALAEQYELAAYTMPPYDQSAAGAELEVAVLFGFPKLASAPLIWGSAAAPTRPLALTRAIRECVQRAGFLWGASIPTEAPAFSAAADYHQEFFLWPAAHERLRAWLAGDHVVVRSGGLPRSAPAAERVWRYADVGRGRVRSMWVMRAIPEGELPLVFGLGHPAVSGGQAEPFAVHPIC